MYMIQSLNNRLGRLAQALALGLVVFGVAFLLACSNGQDTEPTEVPQPTATPTPTAAVTTTQPTQEAPRTTAVPTSTAAATATVTTTQPTQEAPRTTAVPTSTAAATATPLGSPLQVVTTSNIVADWAEVIGGDRVEVFGLVPPGSDPHNFIPGARDVARVADADLVLIVGLGLEVDWLEDLLNNARSDQSKVVALGDGIGPLEFMEMGGHDDHEDEHEGEFLEELRNIIHEVEDAHISAEQGLEEIEELLAGMDHHGEQEEAVHEIVHQFEDGLIDAEKAIEEIEHIAEGEEGHGDHMDEHDDHEGEDEHGHDHGPLDPHFWFDPNRVKIAVNDIAAQLSALDPEGAAFYYQNAADYSAELDDLHSWIEEQVELIRPERRLLVTSHDTFAYFADVYGFEIIGALIPSLAPDVEPSAEHLAGLVDVIREHNAPAVFSETTVSGKLPEALARETGAGLFQLYADSLGERGTDAGTYLGMMRANVEVLVEALQ